MINFISFIIFSLWIFILIIILFLILFKIHPIIIIFSIIIFNIILCTYISIKKSNYLYSLLIFLIIIRGLLIIFIYFSRLISNEQSSIKLLNLTKSTIIILINLIIFFYLINFYFINLKFINSYNFNEINSIFNIFINKNINIINLYIYPLNNLTLLSIFFLLISFFRIIKINSSSHSYSIRKILN